MARTREGTITETIDELRALRERSTSPSERKRLTMLIMLSAGETFERIAGEIGGAERNIRRWWKRYRDGGLGGLLLPSPTVRAGDGGAGLTGAKELVAFLNALPQTDDAVEWINALRHALQQMLWDVDRVSIDVNMGCDLHEPSAYRTDLYLTQLVAETGEKYESSIATRRSAETQPAAFLIENFRRQKFPLEQYHPPHFFDYHVAGIAYVGAIFLWREKRKPPISQPTLDTLRSLEPFMTFLLSDCVARRPKAGPDIDLFADIVGAIAESEGLTRREMEVLLNRLLGKDYGYIADSLNITRDTVRKHVKNIHRKTKASVFSFLFARYIREK